VAGQSSVQTLHKRSKSQIPLTAACDVYFLQSDYRSLIQIYRWHLKVYLVFLSAR